MSYSENITWIKGTPLGLRIRNIEFVPTHMHENIVEILFCLKGSVRFSYGFEEFCLTAGEFITVDKDAHYIYKGDVDNICVSFFLDLNCFLPKYPFVTSLLYVCEATIESSRPYPTFHHKQMKGILLAILFYITNHSDADDSYCKTIITGTERIVKNLIDHFDIIYYYNPNISLKSELLERNRSMQIYMNEHFTEKITLESMAGYFGLTKSYVSEFLRVFEVGFRKSLGYIRANKSEKLLLDSELNINEISEVCGFSDPKYYYGAFKEWYKCTPRQFRVIYRNNMDVEEKGKDLNLKDLIDALNEMMQLHYLDLFLY